MYDAVQKNKIGLERYVSYDERTKCSDAILNGLQEVMSDASDYRILYK